MSSYPGKRAIDVLASTLLLLILWPLMLLLAIWVRLDSPGPALFRQMRIGTGQVPFEILKFRTMSNRPAELIDQVSEKPLTSNTDVRITGAGRILRKTSLDELPQLINILRGDMSLVGPRPILPEQVHAIPRGRFQRFQCRPGVTGWAQVTGRRQLDWLNQIEADTYYADHCSLILDLRIIFRTIATVFRPNDVYGEAKSNWRSYYRTPEESEGTA